MNTTIVYVVTSDETDVYLEQTLLSVFSLRKHNPNACVELVVDQDTDTTITGKRGEILKYIDKKVVVNVPEKYNKVCRSRWLKTSLRQHVKGDFLYIDTDTIVTDDLSEIDSFQGSIGAVRNAHVPISLLSERYSSKIKKCAYEDDWKYNDEVPFYNCGVLFVRDTDETYEFFHFWHNCWKSAYKKYNRYIDQSPFAATNEKFEYPINELSGEWNCQLAGNGISHLVNAKIMHYLNYGNKHHPWLFYDHSILHEIKELGYIPNHISELVAKAKESFAQPNTLIKGISSDYLKLFESPLFSICRKNKKVFSILNYAARVIQKVNRIRNRFLNKYKHYKHLFLLDYFPKVVISKRWKNKMGYPLDWKHPRDINEKIQWLLVYSDTSEWTRLADKYKVREYVKEKGLENLLVPLYGVWETTEEIDFDRLPDRYVIKCNHDYGSTIIVDKNDIYYNRKDICGKLDKCLKCDYGYNGELHYRGIPRKIIAEKYLEMSDSEKALSSSIIDYKVWCFNGKPCSIITMYNRTKDSLFNEAYDLDWNAHPEYLVPDSQCRIGNGKIPKPKTFSEMMEASSILSKGFPEVRVDFYEIDGRLFFGEMTFTSGAGMMKQYTPEYRKILGDLVILPKRK